MSGSKRAPDTFAASLPLAEALERALGHGDDPGSLTASAAEQVVGRLNRSSGQLHELAEGDRPVPTTCGAAGHVDSVHAELPGLVKLARRVEGSAQAVEPSDAFRLASRTRLVATMRASAVSVAPAALAVSAASESAASQVRQPRRQAWRLEPALSGWFARLAAAFSAVVLAGAATASASASALPGDALYGIKQAAEQVALVTAPDDAARQQILVRQADTRLDETSRLLEQGRDAEAGQEAVRYSEVLERATDIVGVAEPVDTRLEVDRARLASLLAKAPPPAQPGLQRALAAAGRGLTRSQRDAHSGADAQPQHPRPGVVQQASEVSLEGTPASTATPSPTTAGPGTAGQAAPPKSAGETVDAIQRHDAAEPRANESRHDAAPETVDGGHANDSAASAVGPPERPSSSAPAVDKPRGAPATQVHPARPGRP